MYEIIAEKINKYYGQIHALKDVSLEIEENSLFGLLGVNGELALNAATDKFLKRFRKTEELVLKDGKNMKELSEKELDKYYNEAKKY